METNNNKKTSTKSAAERPVHMVRRGAIAASIWQRQTQTGFAYHEFTLSRSWKSKSGEREGYSSSFFIRNAADLATVIEGASTWIAEQEQAALDSVPTTDAQAA
ncbi:hypothetical protein [Botrimarina mediterranea]|uniref:hypothetical protein n=1 Tax=Botrimarina mediterranea TaxID=2528022 RepID=UPI001189625E|nr:hypothetical protein K2D_46620 [Planctomycetes bacterium K2D]